ncbi:MAG: APC family permease [Cyclobacteriaceae bacterium]
MTDRSPNEKLPRTIGVWGLWMLVINGFVGAGIFGLPSGAAALAGEYSIFIYIVCALLMFPVILCFAELSSIFSGTGGPIRYATAAFNPFMGFQAGWLFYIARVVSFAANSVLLTDSLAYFVPVFSEGIYRIICLALICGFLTLVNVLGAVRSIRSLAVATVLKFVVLILLIFAGLVVMGARVLPSFNEPMPVFSDLGAAALLLIYAFVGFEGGVVPAGEARNPARDMPRALLLALLSVVILYVLIQMVSLAVVPDIAESTSPLLDVAAGLLGTPGSVILMVGVVASVGGNLIAAMFSTPRLTYALAIDGHLPSWFGKVHSKFMTPANSIIFYGVLSFLLAIFGSFIWLAASTVLSRLFLYIISCAAVPRLRNSMPSAETFRVPGGVMIPVLAVLACIWLMFQVSSDSILATAGYVGLGTLLYLFRRMEK